MNRIVAWIAGLAGASVLVYWIAGNTEWTEVKVPLPARGEAATNPFYAAQRFAAALGARTSWDRQLEVPAADAAIVVSAWHWSLTERRRYSLERWVESGGRLVVAGRLAGGEDEFERWSGVTRTHRKRAPAFDTSNARVFGCRQLTEAHGASPGPADAAQYTLCDADPETYLETTRKISWAVRDEAEMQAVRVAVGRGSVTAINASPFNHRSLLDGDHGRLFVAAVGLRTGDEVHFLSEDDHPSLLALLWIHGSPVVVLALAAIALGLWRNSARFGPLVNEPPAARRSLAEQIRGTGQFALRYGDGESLHAASLRALTEAAARRVPGYVRLSPADQAAALARLTGFDRDAFAAAAYHAGLRRRNELLNTIAFLETARREILSSPPSRPGHHRLLFEPWNRLNRNRSLNRSPALPDCVRPSPRRWSASQRSSSRCSSRSLHPATCSSRASPASARRFSCALWPAR